MIRLYNFADENSDSLICSVFLLNYFANFWISLYLKKYTLEVAFKIRV